MITIHKFRREAEHKPRVLEPPSLFGVLVSSADVGILWVCEVVDPVGHMLLFAVGAMAAA